MPTLEQTLANLRDLTRVFRSGRYVRRRFDASYVEKADRHALSPTSRYEQERVVSWLKTRQRRCGRILDVGCNAGRPLATVCGALEAEGVGVDISAAALERGRRDWPALDLQAFEGARLPFDGESFDHVMLHHVLGHVPDPIASLAEAHRVLRPGGTLSIVTANALYKVWQFPLNLARGFRPDPTALRYMTPGRLRRLIARTGLQLQTLSQHGDTPAWCPPWLASECHLFLLAIAVKRTAPGASRSHRLAFPPSRSGESPGRLPVRGPGDAVTRLVPRVAAHRPAFDARATGVAAAYVPVERRSR